MKCSLMQVMSLTRSDLRLTRHESDHIHFDIDLFVILIIVAFNHRDCYVSYDPK